MKALLTQTQAENRAKSVETGIVYNLYINLQKGEDFNGMGHYTFKLLQTDNVFLDFCGKSIDSLNVNDHELSKEKIAEIWKNGFIHLPKENLIAGSLNKVILTFSNSYYHDGNGLHSYIDTDGKQYTYCQSEPYWINRVYPVFDQPDLKGYMNFAIQAPSDWKIVSNTNPKKVDPINLYVSRNDIKPEFEKLILSLSYDDFKDASTERTLHVFEQTPLLSSYLFCFVSGPYREVVYDGSDGQTVPMTIYCRDSHYKYAVEQQREIFIFCKKGIEYFEAFFRTKYPFHKYDFIFCPEFSVGAMEYPGVITFNDLYLFQQKPTSTQLSRRGGTIVHELAHMWFGNLVTMKWWNDLWLNESFADFTAFLAMANFNQHLPFTASDGWVMLNLRKTWGYGEDQAITTHPIACEVSSTDKADSIFDGITYSKGASVLKQLYFLIGHDQFSENLGNYFAKYQWKNATLENFLEELSKSKVPQTHEAYDLQKWNADWIQTAGLNDIRAEWDCKKQGASKLIIHQTPVLEYHPTLRYHKIKVAFFDNEAKIAEVKEVLINKSAETVVEFENKNYQAILLNYEDWDFVKVTLDDASLDFFLKNVGKIQCSLSQLLIVRSMHDMVRQAKLKGTDFINNILTNYLEHTLSNGQILEAALTFIESALYFYTPKRFWLTESDKLFNKIKELLIVAKDQDQIKILKSKLLQYASSDSSIEHLRQVLEDSHSQLKGLNLTNEEKWKIIFKIHHSKAFTDTQKKIFRDFMSFNDNTDTKKNSLLSIEALIANQEKTEELLKQYFSADRKMSYSEMGHSLHGLNSWHRSEELRQPLNERYFKDAHHLIVNDQKLIAKTFIDSAFPVSEDFDFLITNLQSLNDNLDEQNEYFKIHLLKKIDDLRRKKAAHALFN
jgi:aminopeptidase N